MAPVPANAVAPVDHGHTYVGVVDQGVDKPHPHGPSTDHEVVDVHTAGHLTTDAGMKVSRSGQAIHLSTGVNVCMSPGVIPRAHRYCSCTPGVNRWAASTASPSCCPQRSEFWQWISGATDTATNRQMRTLLPTSPATSPRSWMRWACQPRCWSDPQAGAMSHSRLRSPARNGCEASSWSVRHRSLHGRPPFADEVDQLTDPDRPHLGSGSH